MAQVGPISSPCETGSNQVLADLPLGCMADFFLTPPNTQLPPSWPPDAPHSSHNFSGSWRSLQSSNKNDRSNGKMSLHHKITSTWQLLHMHNLGLSGGVAQEHVYERGLSLGVCIERSLHCSHPHTIMRITSAF